MHFSQVQLAALLSVIVFATPLAAQEFDCVENTCKAITSCAEAYYKFEVCGHDKRDRNNDGIPCEDVCGTDRVTYLARARAQWPTGLAFVEGKTPQPAPALGLIPPAQADEPEGGATGDSFTCLGKRTCKEMFSCAEAKHYLNNCGLTALDGDGNGIPCASLCPQ